MNIGTNLEMVYNRIEKAAAVSGRKKEDIKLVAVTKTIDIEIIKQAAELGMTSIGENRVQEIMNKYPQLEKYPLEWHMIGHLQKNKVKYIVDKVKLIHSVDNIALAEEINRRALKKNIIADILVQINVSGEESKYGLHPDSFYGFLEKAGDFKNVHIRGLMTIAPYTDNPEEVRPVFAELKKIFEYAKDEKITGVDMDYLSMGMTGDFTVAIEEGANIVRIGTGLFGRRKQ